MRCGASPSQKGMLGGAPWASSTKTLPAGSMRWMRQEVLPRRTTSPGEESTAKCSSRVAICTPSGCRMTAKSEVSGIAPPFEMAIDAGAAAGVEVALDGVAEEVGAVAAAAGFDAEVEEFESFVEVLAGEVAVGVGAAKDVVEGVFVPGFRRRSWRRSAA